MKKTKKALSIVLALLMIFTSLVFPSFATGDETTKKSAVKPTVSLNCERTNYVDGEKINLTASVSNQSDDNQNIKLTFSSTPLISLHQTSDLSIDKDSVIEKTVQATAKHVKFNHSKIQMVYDILAGYVSSLFATIISFFSTSRTYVRLTVDGLPAVAWVKCEVADDSEEQPTEPDEPSIPEEPDDPSIEQGTEFQVTFILNDQSSGVYLTYKALGNSKINPPQEPTRDGFNFIGWYNEPSCVTQFNFETEKIKGDTILYAGWQKQGTPSDMVSGSSGDDYETIYSITGFEIEGNEAIVTINVNELSALIVKIIDEDTGEEVGTLVSQTPEKCELQAINIPIDFNLPEFFVAQIQLVDENMNLRCDEYKSIRYTRAYKEFESKTVYDFPEEQVINFDYSDKDNFGILNEDVITLSQNAETNNLTVTQIAGDDESEPVNEYTFKNPSQDMTNLRIGDKIYALDDNGQGQLFKIASIDTFEDRIVIKEDIHNQLDEFYEYLRFDTGTLVQEQPRTRAIINAKARSKEEIHIDETGLEIKFPNVLKFEKELFNNVTLKGSVDVSGKLLLKMVYDLKVFGKDYFMYEISASAKVEGEIGIEAEQDFDKINKNLDSLADTLRVEIPTPVVGLNIHASLGISANLSLTGGFYANFTANLVGGLLHETGNGTQKIKKDWFDANFESKASVELKVAPRLAIGLDFLGDVVKSDIADYAGVKVSATAHLPLEQATNGEEIHACRLCIEGDIKWFYELKTELSYNICDVLTGKPIDETLFSVEGKIWLFGNAPEFYISIFRDDGNCFGSNTGLKMGGGECPNKKYRTRITLKDSSGQVIEGTSVQIKRQSGTLAEQGNSTLIKYLSDGNYIIKTDIEGQSISKAFVINKAAEDITITKDSRDGSISGRVVDANTQSPLQDIDVVIKADDQVVKNMKTDSNGAYSLSVPDGIYLVEITANGYIPFEQYVSVQSDDKYVATTLMIAQNPEYLTGGISGKITNAVYGNNEKNVKVSIYKGWDNKGYSQIEKETHTDESGYYEFSRQQVFGIKLFGLKAGNYTIKLEKHGYTTSYFNVIVKPGEDIGGQNGTISPAMAQGVYNIVLTWDRSVPDLDSHYAATNSNGSREHVYYDSMSSATARLDRDDTNYEGPETITVTKADLLDGGFTYYVHDYSNRNSSSSSVMSNSNAKVELKLGDTVIREYYIPQEQIGTLWTVFRIEDDGRIVDINQFSNQSSPSAVGS